MIRALPFVLVAAFAVGCSSSTEDPVVVKRDTGVKDTGTSLEDSSMTEDTGDEDTGTPTGDSTTPTDTTTPSDTSVTPSCKAGDPTIHTGDECDMVKQNCSDPKATCEYDPTPGHNTCTTRSLGTGTKGGACASPADCDRGLFCYSKHCTPACCTGDNSVCGTGGSCDTLITDDSSKVIYQVCSYAAKCNPFKYDCPAGEVCLFAEAPDSFRCSAPTGSLGVTPGTSCKFKNDCGESQACLSKAGADAGDPGSCSLFCWLTKPTGFTPGTMPGGRFPANGDCVVGGKSYGTCKAGLTGLGGGLGICSP